MGKSHRTLRLTESRGEDLADPPVSDPVELRSVEEPRASDDRGTPSTVPSGIAERRERWFRLREEVERRLSGAP